MEHQHDNSMVVPHVALARSEALKFCATCRQWKSACLDVWYFDKAQGRLYPRCKACHRSQSIGRYHATTTRETRRRRGLMKRYGITLEQYDEMLAAQGGTCICGALPSAQAHGVLHVDHDHVSGRVRGLLCSRCNNGVAWLEADEALLDRLRSYLEASRVG